MSAGRTRVPPAPARPWARVTAWLVVASVVPSSLWRIAIASGLDLGTTDAWRSAQDVPGAGSVYVLGITAVLLVSAGLSLRLVRAGGDSLPRRLPRIGGRPVPPPIVVGVAALGALTVASLATWSALHWEDISSYQGEPTPAGRRLATAAYAPSLAWGPLLALTTWDYWRRHRAPRPADCVADK